MIIASKKFDIRQWVLVTDWNPLTVWIYEECYIRFAMMDYDPSNKSNFAHLTNNSLVKKFCEEESDEEEEDQENIWSLDEFRSHLQGEFGPQYPDKDVFDDIISK